MTIVCVAIELYHELFIEFALIHSSGVGMGGGGGGGGALQMPNILNGGGGGQCWS